MLQCPNCGTKNENYAKFCINCGHAFSIEPEGGFMEETSEYLGRKMLSILMLLGGTIILFFSGLRLLGSFFTDLISYVGCIVSLLMILYSVHYWEKVNHIMWARQAFREYGLITTKGVKEDLKENAILSDSLDRMMEGYVKSMSKGLMKWIQHGEYRGFQVHEIPEYMARKTVAALMMVFGFILLVASIPLLFLLGLGLITFLAGIALLAYGNNYWTKVTVLMWTRQALREYGAVSTHSKAQNKPMPEESV